MQIQRNQGNKSFMFLHGREINTMPESELMCYEKAAFVYWRKKGFPYPRLTNQKLVCEYLKFAHSNKPLFKTKRVLGWSPLGLSLANYFHPEMWLTKCEGFRTPMEVYRNDMMLRDCIHKALKFGRDRRPMTASNLRQMLATYVNTKRVSNFRPSVARVLYERYSPDRGVILDPAAGYGGRMVGALPLDREYIGIDPNTTAFLANKKMEETLSKLSHATIKLINERAEDALTRFESSLAHLVIFSPPYFRRERYCNEPTQSWLRYHTYYQWKSEFLASVLEQCKRILCRKGFLILNVANTETHPVANDACMIAKELFRFQYSYKMLIGSVPYHRNGKHGGFRHEPLYIYRKD